MCDQDDKAEEVKERIVRKQRELVRLAEVEEEEETPPRSQVPATAAATPQEAWVTGAGQQEVAWYQGERASYQQALQNGQVWGEQQGAERRQPGQALELGEVKGAGGQDLMAMIRLEGGELTTEIRKSIDELRSVQDRHRGATWLEETTTQGPKIPGRAGTEGG